MVKNPLGNAGDVGSIPGLGTKMSHAIRHNQKIKSKNNEIKQSVTRTFG